MTATHIPRIIIPRHEGGSDWGVDTVVVARRGTKELRWWPGRTAWTGLGSTGYYPASMITVDSGQDLPMVRWYTVCEGGRLSRKLILAYSSALNAFFGPGAAKLIAANLKRGVTVVLE